MILFLDDWKRFPTAIVDTKTKNRTFVELADKYHAMGIKNYFFHLALYQPQLQGWDPHAPDLPPEIINMMYQECMANPWYFFREVFRLPSQGSPDPDPLRANRGNIGAYWSFFNHIDVALLQPRQTGKSVGADGINNYVTQVAGRNTLFSLVTKDNDLRGKNIIRLKKIRDLMPYWLNPFNKKVDADNLSGLTAKIYENYVYTAVAQGNEADALNLGRGSTSPNNQIDEGPFCSFIHITIPAFLSAASAARENAARNKSFYGNIYTTTAGKLDTKEGKYMYDMFMGGMVFDERALFDCKDVKQAQLMVERHTKPQAKPLVYICLSHKQLGYTDEWLYDKIRDSNSTRDEADRDWFNRWTTGSLHSPLSTVILEAMRSSVIDVKHIEITPRMYCFNWYIPEDQIETRLASGKFVLGNDTSAAVGKDAITLLLQDSETLEVIGSLALTETNVYTFIEWFGDLMLKYPNIITIPERKSAGETLVDGLLVKLVANNINPFQRIYNTIIDEGLHLNPDKQTELSFLRREPITWPTWVIDKYKTKFGYHTSGSGIHARDNLYKETLTRLAELNANTMHDNRLVTEVASLVVKNGRIDHPEKGHDDMVVAWLLNGWFLLHSRNLDYYGITNPAGKAVEFGKTIVEAQKTEYQEIQDEQQEELLEKIKRLATMLENEDDYLEMNRIEQQIRMLSQRLHTDKIESRSIDDFIRASKNARLDNIRERRAA